MSVNWDARYETGTLCGRIVDDRIRLSILGSDWEISEIGDKIRHLTAAPKKTGDGTGEVSVPLTWAMVTQCARFMIEIGKKWQPSPELIEWVTAEFMRRHDEYSPDPGLTFDVNQLGWTPMPHQIGGAYVGALNERFFFADDMRTGKTRTALLTLAEMEARGKDPWPAFVVAPASVVDPWMEELEAAFPDWPVAAYRGPRRQKLSTRYKVYVMSWNTFRDDMHVKQVAQCEKGTITELTRAIEKAFSNHQLAPETYAAPLCPCCRKEMTLVDTSRTKIPPLLEFLVPKTLVLDEAHALCNVKTRQSVMARRCARVAKYAFPMSGTPITHDVGGFWSALNVLDIRSFPDQERYQARYTDRFNREYGNPEVEGISTANKNEFFTLMQGSMRRISRSDVNKDLPPKTYQTRAVDVPAAHRKAYDEMRDDMIAHIPDTDEPLPVMTVLAQLQRLSQLASSACDVEIVYELDDKPGSETYGEMVPKYNVTMREPSWKIDALMELMDDNRGEPLICFSPHTQLVKLAGARAEKMGYRVGYIVGGQNQASRTGIRKAFNAGKLDLLCANVTAGGVGLTLTGTDTIVFLERPWAYWQADQAQSRADDIRNAKQVHIIDIVAKNTVESRVREALKSKAGSLAELVRDPRIVEELLGGQPLRVLVRSGQTVS
jgi:SNF2 family DNA or RNA helicase